MPASGVTRGVTHGVTHGVTRECVKQGRVFGRERAAECVRSGLGGGGGTRVAGVCGGLQGPKRFERQGQRQLVREWEAQAARASGAAHQLQANGILVLYSSFPGTARGVSAADYNTGTHLALGQRQEAPEVRAARRRAPSAPHLPP